MQFLPVLQEMNDGKLTQTPCFTATDSTASPRNVYSWPTGWKDLKNSSPGVQTDFQTEKTSEVIAPQDNLPKIILEESTNANEPKRGRLRRQGKIYQGLGTLLPPLEDADKKLIHDIKELAARSLSVDECPSVDTASPNNNSCPVDSQHSRGSFRQLSACSFDQNHIGPLHSEGVILPCRNDQIQALLNSRVPSFECQGNQKYGYAVFHDGVYYEIRDKASSTPELDKQQLKMSPISERHSQEEYIQLKLAHLQCVSSLDPSLEIITSKHRQKRVTFSPDVSQFGSDNEMTHTQRRGRGKDVSKNTWRNQARKVDLTKAILKTFKGRIRQASQDDQTSRDDLRDHSPSSRSPKEALIQTASQRQPSPWKARFQERLAILSRRTAEKVKLSHVDGTNSSGAMSSANIQISAYKHAIRDDSCAQTLINPKEGNEKSRSNHDITESVPGDEQRNGRNGFDLHGAAIQTRKVNENNTHKSFEKERSERARWKRRARVSATATKRRDYVFQFANEDRSVTTESKPLCGRLREWSVEYLEVEKTTTNQLQSHGSLDKNNIPMSKKKQRESLTAKLVSKSTNGTNMGLLYQMRTDKSSEHVLSKVKVISNEESDSDLPIPIRTDYPKDYSRNMPFTDPYVKQRSKDGSKGSTAEGHRLYVGTTVHTQRKKKLSRKIDANKGRYTSRKVVPSKLPGKEKRKHLEDVHCFKDNDSESKDVTLNTDLISSTKVPDIPNVTVVQDQEESIVSSGPHSQQVNVQDAPGSPTISLKVTQPNTTRSSLMETRDNSSIEDSEDEDMLGDLIQVSQVSFTEKERLKRQSHSLILQAERTLQRSPRPRLSKSNPPPPLPPIGSKVNDSSNVIGLYETGDGREEESKSRQDIRQDTRQDIRQDMRQDIRAGRLKPWMRANPHNLNLPRLQTDCGMTSSLAVQAREDINRVVSEIEKMRWTQQQHEEKSLTYAVNNFISPRVVLVSSRTPRCHSMRKAVRKDKNVIFIVYDFDSWSFEDIIGKVRSRLDQYSKDCKMHSLLLLCGGGVGYCYLLKNYVMTPQKLMRPDYAPVLEFWSKVGTMTSKLNPEEARISIMGCSLDADKQGREILAAIRRAVHPNIVRVESPSEHLAEGRKALNQFFVYRRFLLWRTTNDDLVSKLGQGELDRERTWSELAEDGESDS